MKKLVIRSDVQIRMQYFFKKYYLKNKVKEVDTS